MGADLWLPSRVLVTGATGFVGSALTQLFDQQQIDWVGTSRSSSARYSGGGNSVVVPDLGPESDWREGLHGCEAVVHLAARAHVMQDKAADPEQAFNRANWQATERLAVQAIEAGVRRLVFLSTIKVNGERTCDQPMRATDPAQPQDAYSRSKWRAEEALKRFAANSGLEVVIIRPPLVYGAGVKGNLAALERLIHRRLPLPLGAVRNRRSLVGVRNLSDLILRAIQHPAAAGGTFLVSDGQPLSTPGIIRAISKAQGRSSCLLNAPPGWLRLVATLLGKAPAAERLLGNLEVDMSATQALLDWEPPFTVEEEFHAAFGPQ